PVSDIAHVQIRPISPDSLDETKSRGAAGPISGATGAGRAGESRNLTGLEHDLADGMIAAVRDIDRFVVSPDAARQVKPGLCSSAVSASETRWRAEKVGDPVFRCCCEWTLTEAELRSAYPDQRRGQQESKFHEGLRSRL